MIRHGFAECGGCHVDPMGGETLTGMGRVTGETLMSTSGHNGAPTDRAKLLFGLNEPDSALFGGSFRGLSVYDVGTASAVTFPMQLDVYGAAFAGDWVFAGSFGASRADARYEHTSKAVLVGNIRDEGMVAVSRNHWIGYKLLPDVLLRAGRINLPFGIRTPDHTMWVRDVTLTDRESDQQHGISGAYSGNRLRAELMVSFGNFQIPQDRFRERGYSGYAEYLLDPNLALGVSSLFLTPRRELVVDQRAITRQAHGLTARYVPFKDLVVLAEADVFKKTGAGFGYVGFTTFDFEPVQGLHLAATGEVKNAGAPTSEDSQDGLGRGKPRLGAWLTANWFILPHLDLRVDAVMRQEGRPTLFQSQLHFYL
jgi:hypothetical protein